MLNPHIPAVPALVVSALVVAAIALTLILSR